MIPPVPTPLDNGRAVQVDLNLGVGDTAAAGGSPNVVPPGWKELQKLGLTKGRTNWLRWVRFHLVNEDQGGPDHLGNLPPTTQQANHDPKWMNLEFELDRAARDPADRPLHFYAFTHYPASRKVYWRVGRGGNKKDVVTDSSHYPDRISGYLRVGGALRSYAILDDKEGAIAPEDLKKVPYATAKDSAGRPIVGRKG